MSLRRDEAGRLVKQQRRRAASAGAELKAFAAVHSDLQPRKVKADFLDEALNVSKKEFSAVEVLVKKQMTHLDVASARMVELKNVYDGASALIDTFCKNLLPVQKSFVAALQNVEVNLTCVFGNFKEPEAKIIKFVRATVELGAIAGFAIK